MLNLFIIVKSQKSLVLTEFLKFLSSKINKELMKGLKNLQIIINSTNWYLQIRYNLGKSRIIIISNKIRGFWIPI